MIALLRQTLEHLQETQDLLPNDPALLELKHSIVSAVAELKIATNGKSHAA